VVDWWEATLCADETAEEKTRMQLLPPQVVPASMIDELDAEAKLVEALLRLDRLRRAALFGGAYDPDEYDAAIMDYRQARAAAAQTRAWSLPASPYPS
jgi:hypothetical protein